MVPENEMPAARQDGIADLRRGKGALDVRRILHAHDTVVGSVDHIDAAFDPGQFVFESQHIGLKIILLIIRLTKRTGYHPSQRLFCKRFHEWFFGFGIRVKRTREYHDGAEQVGMICRQYRHNSCAKRVAHQKERLCVFDRIDEGGDQIAVLLNVERLAIVAVAVAGAVYRYHPKARPQGRVFEIALEGAPRARTAVNEYDGGQAIGTHRGIMQSPIADVQGAGVEGNILLLKSADCPPVDLAHGQATLYQKAKNRC